MCHLCIWYLGVLFCICGLYLVFRGCNLYVGVGDVYLVFGDMVFGVCVLNTLYLVFGGFVTCWGVLLASKS